MVVTFITELCKKNWIHKGSVSGLKLRIAVSFNRFFLFWKCSMSAFVNAMYLGLQRQCYMDGPAQVIKHRCSFFFHSRVFGAICQSNRLTCMLKWWCNFLRKFMNEPPHTLLLLAATIAWNLLLWFCVKLCHTEKI